MKCLSCHKPISDTAKFCNLCGANQVELKVKADEEANKQEKEKRIAREVAISKARKYALSALVTLVIAGGGYFAYSKLQGENLAEIKTPPLVNNSSSTYVQEFIKLSIQNYQPSMDCYVDSYIVNNNQQRYCIKVSEVYDGNEAGNQYVFATLTGISVDDNNQPEEYHAASGLIELLKFKKEANDYKLLSSFLVPSGSYGKPGITKIIPLGKNNIGWAITDSYSGMGEFSSYLSFFSTSNDKLHNVLTITSDFSNKDACDPENKSCAFKAFSFAVRQNKNQDQFYPIKISGSVVTGTLGQSKAVSKDYVLNYDSKKGSYSLPADLTNLIRN